MNEYTAAEESDTVVELIIVVLLAIVGFTSISVMIVNFTNRLDKYERYDKVAAGAMWEEAYANTYNFNAYQAYMMGYFIEPWGPPNMEVLYTANTDGIPAGEMDKHRILLSSATIGNNKTIRNNLVSGANGQSPSVRSVLDEMKVGLDYDEFYRSKVSDPYKRIYLNWGTRGVTPHYDEDFYGLKDWNTLDPAEKENLKVIKHRWALEDVN